jgi:hypothetical protein
VVVVVDSAVVVVVAAVVVVVVAAVVAAAVVVVVVDVVGVTQSSRSRMSYSWSPSLSSPVPLVEKSSSPFILHGAIGMLRVVFIILAYQGGKVSSLAGVKLSGLASAWQTIQSVIPER